MRDDSKARNGIPFCLGLGTLSYSVRSLAAAEHSFATFAACIVVISLDSEVIIGALVGLSPCSTGPAISIFLGVNFTLDPFFVEP
jgi:hypothetical protein